MTGGVAPLIRACHLRSTPWNASQPGNSASIDSLVTSSLTARSAWERSSGPPEPPWRPERPEDRSHAERAESDEVRSEEHTSELQSRQYLVCPLLLEQK